jgi:AraC-like DNA-binding protein
LPFLREPVTANQKLADAIEAAFRHGTEPLAIDDLIVRLAEALLEGDQSCGAGATPIRLDSGAIARAREFLDAETTRVVRSSELEAVTGLTRYDLARQFRAAFGTSPYRYSLMRRLDGAWAQLRRDRSLADVALAAGFADQPHLSRMFKAAFGITPARYRELAEVKRGDASSP